MKKKDEEIFSDMDDKNVSNMSRVKKSSTFQNEKHYKFISLFLVLYLCFFSRLKKSSKGTGSFRESICVCDFVQKK